MIKKFSNHLVAFISYTVKMLRLTVTSLGTLGWGAGALGE